MQFDLFMGSVAVVGAAMLTWFVIRFFGKSVNNAAVQPPTGGGATPESTVLDSRITRLTRKLTLATVLTVPVLIVALLARFLPSLPPTWLTSPWLQAIFITPVVFYCGTSIHHKGWADLKAHNPSMNVLITLATSVSYIYSFIFCVAGPLLPDNSHPYFEVTGIIIAMALLIELLELGMVRHHLFGANTKRGLNASEIKALTHANRFIQVYVIVVLIAAIWLFVLMLVLGPQPRLANALICVVGLFIIADFLLAAYSIGKLAYKQR